MKNEKLKEMLNKLKAIEKELCIVGIITLTVGVFIGMIGAAPTSEELTMMEKVPVLEQQNEELQLRVDEFEAVKKAEEDKKQKEADEAAKKKADEAAKKKKEEDKKGYDTGITYDNLARNPDDYYSKKVKFKGEVVQVVEGDEITQLRFAVNGDYDKMMLLGIPKGTTKNRILENDTITIRGLSLGVMSYESTMGGTITIPSVAVEKIN